MWWAVLVLEKGAETVAELDFLRGERDVWTRHD